MPTPPPCDPGPGPQGGFDPAFFDVLAAAERRHFWFKARNGIIRQVIRQEARAGRARRLLEIGCGNGNVLRMLEEELPGATVVGVDLFAEGLRHARHRGVRLVVQADVAHPPFRSAFDVVGLFDVIEHLSDDVTALRQAGALAQPGGLVIVTVPAHPSLWSAFDVAAGHCRRYREADLRRSLEAAGLVPEYLTHFMMAAAPLVWAARRAWGWRRRHESSPPDHAAVTREMSVNPVANWCLTRAVSWETLAVDRRVRLPFGSSLLAVARVREG